MLLSPPYTFSSAETTVWGALISALEKVRGRVNRGPGSAMLYGSDQISFSWLFKITPLGTKMAAGVL